MRHLYAVRSVIGEANESDNLSSTAGRFAYNAALEPKQQRFDDANKTNAFRHVTWQAAITARFDRDLAIEVGQAHEENPDAIRYVLQPEALRFTTLHEADQAIDLLNNRLGRWLGDMLKGSNAKDVALAALELFHMQGLWTAVPDGGGKTFHLERTKLSHKEYLKAKANIENTNEFGRTPDQQADYDQKQREEMTERPAQRSRRM